MKRLKTDGHREGRGCTCERCENKRTYAREVYAEKHKGVPRSRASKRDLAPTTRNGEAKNQEPRFHEREQGGGVSTIHWMPDVNKTGAYSWKCPDCPQWFSWSADNQEWVAA